MLALARSCSSSESAIGIPGDLRRAVLGHVHLHHGLVANIGVSIRSCRLLAQPTSASAARCSKLSHA